MIKSITQQPVPIVTFQLLFKSIVIQTYEASKDRPVFYISFIRKSFRNTGTLKKKKKKGKPFPSHIKGLFSKTIIVSFSRIGRAMTSVRELLIFSLFVATSIGLPSKSHRGSHGYPIPPEPRNQGNFEVGYDHVEIARRINSWKPEDPENIWELSGLYQGDIMLSAENKISGRNGILDTATRWPNGVVPYYIEEEDFDRSDIKVIKSGIKEYHNKTCLRFRPYKESDNDYVRIQGNTSGCWSMVGRHGKGQVLNLQVGGCVRHGVVVHELMHALGFYHQQSAANRDEWVVIHWDNIKPGKEHNFKKYDLDTVTDFGYPYDYSSVMHYSAHAFSANGQETITPKVEDAKIGQRNGLSKIDVSKLQAMYKDECDNRETEEKITSESGEDLSFIWALD